jgi:DNA topoisomerase-1
MRAVDKLRADGIRRLGAPRSGFRYRAADGRRPSRADLERIRTLRLPPAWTDVHIAPKPGAKLQAIGTDAAGRVQYRYHPEFQRRRADAKYRRLLRFAGALPRVRAAVERDLRRGDLSRARVLAAMVRLLERCHMRPGSTAYARENHSYGLATLRPRHVRIAGDRVVFDYRGKSGQRQVRELRDRGLAGLVRAVLRRGGGRLFKFVEDGEVHDVRRRHINAYLREISGAPFTAKDFRTWAGTLVCASELARATALAAAGAAAGAPAGGAAARRRTVNAALKAVAARLGNTPAVARASYVSPAVIDAFGRGRCISCSLAPGEVIGRTRRLHPAEEALVALLRASVRRRRSAPVVRLLRGGGRGLGRPAPSSGPTAKPEGRAARAPDTPAPRGRP